MGDSGDAEEFEPDPLGQPRVRAGMTVGELVEAYGEAGIGAASLAEAVDITAEMVASSDTTVLCGLAGPAVPGGLRSIVSDLIADGYIDALVTTGATLTHDTIEAVGGAHHHGRAMPGADRTERREHDERLRTEGVDRIYNVYLPQDHFVTLEDHLRERVFPQLDGTVSIAAFTQALGEANRSVADGDRGIAAAATAADVPIYCPAIQDSVIGLQAWMYAQTSEFSLDALADMTPLSDLVHEADRSGALIVGGGVPKNFVLQAMLVSPAAYDFAVQLTTDSQHTGGLTGATLDEARSWGKLEPDARNVTVLGDATITLPMLVAAVRERVTD